MKKLDRFGQAKLNERYFKLNTHEYTVYVEGDVDTLFWEDIFPEDEIWKPKIEVLKKEDGSIIGGWNNLIAYLEEGIKDKTKINYIIAIDGDYNAILKNKPLNKNIVITKKYNLENYIFCPKSINTCMKKLSLRTFNNEAIIERKFDNFAKIIKNLIILDCINERDKMGIRDYGLQPRDLQNFKYLRAYIKRINIQYRELIQKNKNILDNVNIVDYIRWKCFAKQLNKIINNTVNNFIKKENCTRKNNNIRRIKKLNVEEGLYMLCIENCAHCSGCKDYDDLKLQAKNAFDMFKLSNGIL